MAKRKREGLAEGEDIEDHGKDNNVDEPEISDDDDEENEMVDDDDSSEGETDDSMETEIKVAFEAFPPHESDFDGVKKLLQQLFLKEKDLNLSSLVESLLQLKEVTCIIKQEEVEGEDDEEEEDDLEVYGISSLIDLRKRDVQGIKELVALIARRVEGNKDIPDQAKKSIKSALDSKATSFLIVNERFVNLPPQLSLPCFKSLIEVLNKDAGVDDSTTFFMIMKVMKFKKKDSKNNANSSKKTATEGLLYQNSEEELFVESVGKEVTFFDYCVADQCDSNVRGGDWDDDDVKMIPYRRILMMKKPQFYSAVESLEKELSASK
jgi:protein BCP1